MNKKKIKGARKKKMMMMMEISFIAVFVRSVAFVCAYKFKIIIIMGPYFNFLFWFIGCLLFSSLRLSSKTNVLYTHT